MDHVVLNEARATLAPVLRDLELVQPRRVSASNEFPDIRPSPTPLWELAKRKYYATMSIQ